MNQKSTEWLQTFANGIDNVSVKATIKATPQGNVILIIPKGTKNCYTVSLRAHYIEYAKAELELLPDSRLRLVAPPILSILETILRLGGSEQAIYASNWLVSTNLHPSYLETSLVNLTSELCQDYPDQIIGVRSLNRGHHNDLIENLLNRGYILFPSRQIYLLDTLSRPYRKKRNYQKDLQLLSHCSYSWQTPKTISEPTAAKLIHLYNQLYLDKYSNLNPHFTPEWIMHTHESGFLKITTLHDEGDQIIGVIGSIQENGLMTVPLLGYDFAVQGEASLYRLLSAKITQLAEERNLQLHLSAGADDFKMSRGGVPYLEYSAIYCEHLPLTRRIALKTFAYLLTKLAPAIFQTAK